jgi:hypothetical protein
VDSRTGQQGVGGSLDVCNWAENSFKEQREENSERVHSEQSLSGSRLEPKTSVINVQIFTATVACSAWANISKLLEKNLSGKKQAQ